MKTKAVRLYGKNDLRFETMTLPEIDDDPNHDLFVAQVADEKEDAE